MRCVGRGIYYQYRPCTLDAQTKCAFHALYPAAKWRQLHIRWAWYYCWSRWKRDRRTDGTLLFSLKQVSLIPIDTIISTTKRFLVGRFCSSGHDVFISFSQCGFHAGVPLQSCLLFFFRFHQKERSRYLRLWVLFWISFPPTNRGLQFASSVSGRFHEAHFLKISSVGQTRVRTLCRVLKNC